jgi:sensor domain CHASE-containing protein
MPAADMTIRTRLALLLACLLAIFGLAAAGLRLAHRAEAENILASLRTERSDLLDRLLGLTGQSLRSFADDYSLWDEMVGFVQSGDSAWAAINIDPSLASFDAQGAWVARPDGHLLYTSVTDSGLTPPPFAEPAFLERLRSGRSLHFFADSPAGLLEFRTSPILPPTTSPASRKPAAGSWSPGAGTRPACSGSATPSRATPRSPPPAPPRRSSRRR